MIELCDGQVARAAIPGRPDLREADCVYHALTWSSGTFAFRVCEVAPVDDEGMRTCLLLMEAARREDERGRPPDGGREETEPPAEG